MIRVAGHALPFVLYLLLLNPGLWGNKNSANAVTQTELYSLMTYLFNGYLPEVRPTTQGEETYVYVLVSLLSIQDLNEKSQVLESSIFMSAFWEDDYLSWNSSDYGGLQYFLYPQKKVWLPDVVIENSVESHDQLGYDENKVRIDSTGMVQWKPSKVIKTSCDIDVTYYPFDTQTCNIIISTWMSTQEEVYVDPETGSDGMSLSKYSASGTWELVTNTLELLPNEAGLTRFQYTLKLKRLRTYYVMNIILPVLFLSFTASLVFFLPADAGEKIGMGITVLLAYAVYLTIIADNMPQTSLQVSYLAVYLTLLLGLTAMGVVLAVFVLHLHHKPQESSIGLRTVTVTRSIRRWLGLRIVESCPEEKEEAQVGRVEKGKSRGTLGDVLALRKKQSSVSPSAQGENANVSGRSPPPAYKEPEEEITWPKIAEMLDRLMFLSMSGLIATSTVVFLTILAVGGN